MVGLGFVIVGPIVGLFVALPFYDGGMLELTQALQPPFDDPGLKIPLYVMQGCATAIGLIATPAVYLSTRQRSLGNLFANRKVDFVPVLITIMVVIVFMGVNSIFIEWNAKVNFPEFAKGFEEWAREREDSLGELTAFLTTFGSGNEFVLALIVIAILPAIGEEIVFRGLIQNELRRAANVHVAIWFAAMLFSAIHFQFFGFVPRLLLGALFGYLYYWSGNLVLAIIAHFINNAASVTALYMYQRGSFDFNLESTESMPLNFVVMSALLTAGLLYYFYKYYQDRKIAIP